MTNITINRTSNYPVKTLVEYKRKESLVFATIRVDINDHAFRVYSDWFFACNTDKEILKYLKSENIDVSLFE